MHRANETADDVEVEEHDGFLEARFQGRVSVGRFNRQVEVAIRVCEDRKLERLLVDITRLQGDLTTIDRYEIAAYGTRVAMHLKVVVFSMPERVDVRKFGVQVARNRGLKIDIFTDRNRAIDWLLDRGV